LADPLISWMFGLSREWPLGHPANLLSTRLLHTVRPLQIARGFVNHSLVVTIDARPGGPAVATLLGLSNAACHIPLVIQRETDGRCITLDGLHCYAARATEGAFGSTDGPGSGAMSKLGVLYDAGMLRSMRYPRRSVESKGHSEFDQCGASFAVFANLISGGKLHPKLRDPATFAVFAAVFPELLRLVVDGVPQVSDYTVKHVVSDVATTGRPHQAAHTDPPSPCPRMIVADTATLPSSENSEFCTKYASGIIFSKNNFENLAISTPLGNTETKKSNLSIGAGVCKLVRDKGFVTTDSTLVPGGSVAPASLVRTASADDAAVSTCPICEAHSKWVTAHTTEWQAAERERVHWQKERDPQRL
jgi:hypothetical protein